MKQVIAFCIFIFITFALSVDGKDGFMTISKQCIISPDEIVSMQFSDNTDTALRTIKDDDIKAITDILNTAKYDDERNDGKMFKMTAPQLRIVIRYSDDSEVKIQLWDALMYVNKTWYKIDIRAIKEILYGKEL
ncbi:hypothetical protein ABK01_08975 [Treponema sp. OMZ 305]|uniref:hypothetical protein n=1 Tax=Treponema sp. OMZ 305 TaxID=1659192 RepID=UPI0020A24AAB|nr:hypothetical protein [Treponema sp. OMZ 305]UTC58379.1 hypothetical protein ABK01_08975 [Treponema sp. OMZ 305]